jgi:hypothetical protein
LIFSPVGIASPTPTLALYKYVSLCIFVKIILCDILVGPEGFALGKTGKQGKQGKTGTDGYFSYFSNVGARPEMREISVCPGLFVC